MREDALTLTLSQRERGPAASLSQNKRGPAASLSQNKRGPAAPIEVPLADAIWRLHLPSGYEAVGAGGTMTPEDLPHPPLAAAEVVGWLAGVNDALSRT